MIAGPVVEHFSQKELTNLKFLGLIRLKGKWAHKWVTDMEFVCLNSQLPNPAPEQIVTLPNSLMHEIMVTK